MNRLTQDFLVSRVAELRAGKYDEIVLGNEGTRTREIKNNYDMKEYLANIRTDIDNIIRQNKSKELLYIILIISLFVLSLVIIVTGYFFFHKSDVITNAGTIGALGISIKWPIDQIFKIRESNIHLQKFILIVPFLKPEDAAEQVERILFGKV
jgi:hypothetical protein